MANKIIVVKNNREGSVSLLTVDGLISFPSGATRTLTVTADQLAAIQAVSNIAILQGLETDTTSDVLELVLEQDLNVDVFDQTKLNSNLGKIEAYAAATNAKLNTLETFKTTTEGQIASLVLAMLGDVVIKATPPTLGTAASEASSGTFSREVEVTLETAAGDVHTWFQGPLAISVVASTDGDGDATIEAGTDVVVNGVATVIINYTGTWAKNDTCTLTAGPLTFLGDEVTSATSVDTIVADPSPEG